MARSTLPKLITAAGVILLLLSLVLFTNGYFCTFNKASCGMVEPLIGLPVALAGFVLLVVGLLGLRRNGR
ncbi:hypothetical protein [Cognatilysobacter bugurensis]|uniref:Uncharacterized protein n=1 Tax=Cognatilysobacter bugurensis TaxID=543356 RepID=A0A918T0F0_9GAMM|nr:hypothetical protein [Lysobacter bugurensis]GHA76706.1 hypothetical protein GCM10007067_12470 [Lysobacter bugurensis]